MPTSKLVVVFDSVDSPVVLGQRLKAMREKRGLTQTALATLLNTKQPAIVRLENGQTMPRLDVLSKVARALNITLELKFI